MIVLDTHIWVWWIYANNQLSQKYSEYIQAQESQGLGVSIISCWEVAKLVERSRLILHCPVRVVKSSPSLSWYLSFGTNTKNLYRIYSTTW